MPLRKGKTWPRSRREKLHKNSFIKEETNEVRQNVGENFAENVSPIQNNECSQMNNSTDVNLDETILESESFKAGKEEIGTAQVNNLIVKGKEDENRSEEANNNVVSDGQLDDTLPVDRLFENKKEDKMDDDESKKMTVTTPDIDQNKQV